VEAWWTQTVLGFFLVLCRVGSLTLVAPLFSSMSIPGRVKAGFAAAVALVIYPLVRPETAVPTHVAGLAAAVLGEMFVGLTLGVGAAIVFVGIEMGGTLISRHMGTALANVFNPLFASESGAAMGQFYSFLALVVFLGMNGHHGLLKILIGTFGDMPVMQVRPSGTMVMGVVWMLGDAYVLAFKVAAPVMVSLLLVTVSLGFIARTVPQVEVLIASFPLNVGLGLVVAAVTLGAMAVFFQKTLEAMLVFLRGLMLG